VECMKNTRILFSMYHSYLEQVLDRALGNAFRP
jgi:hypothetical protein